MISGIMPSLVYGISSSFNDWQGGGLSLVEFSTRDQNVSSALDIVNDQIGTPTSVEFISENIDIIKSFLPDSKVESSLKFHYITLAVAFFKEKKH